MKKIHNLRTTLKNLTCAAALGAGLGATSVFAQMTIDVGGAASINDTVLTNTAVPNNGDTWKAEGDAGFRYTGLVSPAVVVGTTGNVTLTFDHRYFIEAAWDGAAVFVSVNGAPSTYLPLAAFSAEGYAGNTLANTPNSAWEGGEDVFYGKSTGYDTPVLITSVADLGPLTAGDTVSVEFRGGWDGGFNEAGTDWEIGAVKLTDAGAVDILDADFLVDGPSGFTVANVNAPNFPFTYLSPISIFEIDGDLLTADRYLPPVPGNIIDLNGANITVTLLAGMLDIGDSFALFDLSGGSSLSGSIGSINFLPGGTWDTSEISAGGTGVITLQIPPDPALVYEPFDDLEPNLDGNTPGKGLPGEWESSPNSSVAAESLSYGALAYQGGRMTASGGSNFQKSEVSSQTLLDNGLLDDGATVWFSVLMTKHPLATNSNRRTYFSLGTGPPDGFDRIQTGPDTSGAGSGFTVVVNKVGDTGVTAQVWNDGSDGTGGATRGATDGSVVDGATFLAVGKITWGAFGVTDDVFELYLPDLDLNLGSVVSTIAADFDQLGGANAANTFAWIGIGGGVKANNAPQLDEIRFAATSADVLTRDLVDPLLVSTDNAVGSASERSATFDEFVYAGTGDIRIVNETNPGTTTITLPDPQVVFSENTLTITPTVPLTGGNIYHIEIDAGAVTDRNLNGFAGISDPDLWEFTVDGTPPTVASFGDNTSPLPILINSSGRLTYTVTFDEPIDAGTVDVTDFGATAGSAPITVDSVTATGPAVFEVAVSTLGTTGTLALEIVMGAVITDVNGNDLVTTTALPSDNTINVNNPVANAGSTTADFQGTISSQDNALDQGGNGRFFHVSVNADNAGTGWWSANDVSGAAKPAGFRSYTGPVLAYKFLGNGGNGDVTSTAISGGDDTRITYTTDDAAFDSFDQQQMRIWTTNDPGADISSAAGVAATGFTTPSYGYRGISQIDGFVDISGQASGSVHIYYGAYNGKPTVKVTLHDSDNVGEDIVILDVHSVADGGNGDSANNGENYVAEIDFVSDGVYDVLEYEYSVGNGNGHGAVLTGPDVIITTDYDDWAAIYDPADLTDPDADLDGDGLSNNYERLFGLDPTDVASTNPITASAVNSGTLSFTRRDDALTGLFSNIETSTDLVMWTTDGGAVLVVSAPDANGVETVDVTLSAGLLTAPKLFTRVTQNNGVLLSENFESDNGGFTIDTVAGTPWAHGDPNSSGFGGAVTEGNGGSTNCWGTNITNPGYHLDPTTDACLRSTIIDLTGVAAASLNFAHAIDLEAGDSVVVNIIDDTTDTIISADIFAIVDGDDTTADWSTVGPIAIPGAALGQAVRIEWCLSGAGGVANDYMGWYIDDVTVKRTTP